MAGDALWPDALAAEDATALRALAAERRYRAGVVIAHHGDEAGAVLVLLEGRVKEVVPGPDAKEVIVGFAGPGDLVGEVAALDRGARSASLEAVDDVRALVVPSAAFERFVRARPAVSMLLLRSLAARLRAADRQLIEFAAYDVTGRVARRLLELCEAHGEPAERGVAITMPLSQDELAAWTASSREAVAKALHLLRRLGWVETHRRRIVVLDPDALREYAG
jgi:CRP-like cAMP-binding protein